MNHRQQPVTPRLAWTCYGLVPTVLLRKIYFCALINISVKLTFFPTATHILLIKSNLKFESRATAVSIAMSSHYLGGKYRSRLHPGQDNASASFLWETEHVNRTAPNQRHLLPVATTKLIMWCVQLLNHGCPLSISMNMASSTQLRYIRAAAGQYVFQWDRLLGEFGFWSSGSSLVSSWCETRLVHEYQMWRQRCKQIDPHWFQMSNVFLVHVINHIVWIFHNIPGPTF